MRDPGHKNTMYMLRSKSVKYVFAYPLQTTLRLFLGEGWSSPLRIHVSAYPLHDQTTLRLFLGKGWSLPLCIHVSTLFREAPLKWQGIFDIRFEISLIYLIWNHGREIWKISNNKTWVVEYRVAYCKQISLNFCRFSPYTINFTSKSNKTVFINTARRVLKFCLC